MAERIRDADDRRLESMFESMSIEDNGFSARIVRKVRRRSWYRKLPLILAVGIGGPIAFQSFAELTTIMTDSVAALPVGGLDWVTGLSGQSPTVGLGAVFLAVSLLLLRKIEA